MLNTNRVPNNEVFSTKVLSRDVLYSRDLCAIVSLRVPGNAEEGKFPSPEGEQKYVWFGQNVTSGHVNYFVHDAKPTRFRGVKIIASVEIKQKRIERTFRDGRVEEKTYPYIDLHPVQEHATPTHRLAVMTEGVVEEEGLVLFPALGGTIVIAPLGTKIVATKANVFAPKLHAVAAVETEEPKVPEIAKNDSQLKRLLAVGWEIDFNDPCTNNKTVLIFRIGKNGERRETVHCRPCLHKEKKRKEPKESKKQKGQKGHERHDKREKNKKR